MGITEDWEPDPEKRRRQRKISSASLAVDNSSETLMQGMYRLFQETYGHSIDFDPSTTLPLVIPNGMRAEQYLFKCRSRMTDMRNDIVRAMTLQNTVRVQDVDVQQQSPWYSLFGAIRGIQRAIMKCCRSRSAPPTPAASSSTPVKTTDDAPKLPDPHRESLNMQLRNIDASMKAIDAAMEYGRRYHAGLVFRFSPTVVDGCNDCIRDFWAWKKTPVPPSGVTK